jgi:hypothetical protein
MYLPYTPPMRQQAARLEAARFSQDELRRLKKKLRLGKRGK